MFMWMSSSASEKAKRPSAISASISASPLTIAAASSPLMIPVAASIAAWARAGQPSPAVRASKLIEALIWAMIADGLAAKRPPHMEWPGVFAESPVI